MTAIGQSQTLAISVLKAKMGSSVRDVNRKKGKRVAPERGLTYPPS